MSEERKAIGNLHRIAAGAVSTISMSLGMWAGNGDWADLPHEAKDRAARRALRDLDEAMVLLAEVREKLAAELDSA